MRALPVERMKEETPMKKALALILAAIMLLCTASFAVADEAQTLTVVA